MKKVTVIIMVTVMISLLLTANFHVFAEFAEEVTAYYKGTTLYRDADCTSVISTSGDAATRAYRATITKIEFVGDVTIIGWASMNFCTSLQSITLPKSVTTIQGYAFHNCTSLKSITIPSSIRSIEWSAFIGCDSLNDGSGITLLYTSSGTAANLYSVYSLIRGVIFDDNVTSIRDFAFIECTGITSITIPDNITSIGQYAFENCGLTSVTIPKNVETISDNAFSNCRSLAQFNVAADNEHYKSVDGVLLDKSETMLIQYPAARTASTYQIPDSIISIGKDAFRYCYNLCEIVIPDRVTSIGDNAFAGCYNLRDTLIPDNVTSIGANAFKECENLQRINISESVVEIGDEAFFYCTNLSRAYFYGNVPTFGEYTFDCVSSDFKIIYPYNKADNWTNLPYPSAAGYPVTFNSQGGSQVTDVVAGEGDKISQPVTPTRYGYAFGGWYKDAECTQMWDFDNDTVTGCTTLYTKWNPTSRVESPAPIQETNTGEAVPDSNGNLTFPIPPRTDTATRTAQVKIYSSALAQAFENVKTKDSEIKTVKVQVPAAVGANAYDINLPASYLASGDTSRAVEIQTEIATVILPSNMLGTLNEAGAKNVSLTVATYEKSMLDEQLLAYIGDKPVIELKLTLDGKETNWNNDNAAVTVSIPYTPTAEELKDPEHITIWYIDNNGKITSVPNGRYDPMTGKVSYSTTHFSKYAVAFVQKTFKDMANYSWARKQVEVLASKGIINYTSDNKYLPDMNITRADYLVSLIRTLGLSAEVSGNFEDVKPGDYYYKEIGIAKKLGITFGSGGNRFYPQDFISRQDMIVLTARALEEYKNLKVEDNSAALDKFKDKKDISNYAIDSLSTFVKNGLITGSGDKICPKDKTSRAEAAVFLYGIYNKYSE